MAYGDGKLIEKIFPNEVWEMILGEVKDAPNYHRISNASPHFRALLLSRAPQILFPQAANLLVTHYVRAQKSLPLRKVCRAWRKGMDQTLQTPNLHSKGEVDECLFGYGRYSLSAFKNKKYFSHFERHFDPTHYVAEKVNPFVSRGIQIKFVCNNEAGLAPLESYYTACNKMLQKYGHHVWFLTIDLWDMNYHELMVDFNRRRLPAILQLTPNIQALVIFCDECFEYTSNLWESMKQRPFPTLPNLKWIYMPETPSFVARELVLKNQQVRGVNTGGNPELQQICMELLPNLTHIQLFSCGPNDFKIFCSTKVSGRLETLWLDIYIGKMPWDEIFSALEFKFSDTLSLTELQLNLPSFSLKDMGKALKLALPNVRRLALQISDDAFPIDFLLPMKNTLERLRVELWLGEQVDKYLVLEKGRQRETDGGVKLYAHWRELSMSTIWSRFPKLKLLHTSVYRKEEEADAREECHSCTRDQWEKAQIDRQ